MIENLSIICYYNSPIYKNLADRLKIVCDKNKMSLTMYNNEWLYLQDEYVKHMDILCTPKGGGYWAWKPLIILDALKSSETVIYMDSSVLFNDVSNLQRVVQTTECLSAPQTSYVNKDWTKRSCFKIMDCDTEEYWNTPQVWAGVVCAKRCGIEIIEEWKKYCLIYDAISDSKCKENFPSFRVHRHDQSILTNILLKHKQFHVDTAGICDS